MRPPEGSVRCPKCGTDAMPVDRAYACDCDVRAAARTAPDEANRLRQVLALLREQPGVCDRCLRNAAYRLVCCSLGCSHAQCFECADHTKAEATAEALL